MFQYSLFTVYVARVNEISNLWVKGFFFSFCSFQSVSAMSTDWPSSTPRTTLIAFIGDLALDYRWLDLSLQWRSAQSLDLPEPPCICSQHFFASRICQGRKHRARTKSRAKQTSLPGRDTEPRIRQSVKISIVLCTSSNHLCKYKYLGQIDRPTHSDCDETS